LVFIEGFGVPVPGETVMIAAAVYAGAGRLNIVAVAAIALLAAVLGDNLGYACATGCRSVGTGSILCRSTGVGSRPRTATPLPAPGRGPMPASASRAVWSADRSSGRAR
jgi:hypothetical protein